METYLYTELAKIRGSIVSGNISIRTIQFFQCYATRCIPVLPFRLCSADYIAFFWWLFKKKWVCKSKWGV